MYSQSKFKSLAGVDVVSNAANNVTRKNIIDIGKGVTLNTAKDLNLYAGARASGENSSVISSTISEASNGLLAISTRPKMTITAQSENKVNINDSSVTVDGKITGNKLRSDNPNYQVEFMNAYRVTKNYKATQGSFDYGKNIIARWNELQKLIANKSLTDNQKGIYLQEPSLLEQKMRELGMLKTSGGKKTVSENGFKINYVELPYISVSGGTINVQTQELTSKGSITVNAMPYIDVQNNSNAWLRVNNLTIDSIGEGFIFNDKRIVENDAKNFKGLTFNLGVSDKSGLTVDNSGSSKTNNGMPNIEIAGMVDAGNYDVTIKNPNGDIIVTESASGDFTQNYSQDTVTIGTKIEDLYSSEVKNFINLSFIDVGTKAMYDKQNGTSYAKYLGAVVKLLFDQFRKRISTGISLSQWYQGAKIRQFCNIFSC